MLGVASGGERGRCHAGADESRRGGLGTPIAKVLPMKPLSSLIREHQYIGRLVDALEAYADQVGRGEDADLADLSRFAAAFTQFADELHHEKEERVLLPFLARSGLDWDAPPLSRVRREHRQERYLIEVLSHAGQRLEQWSDEERRHVSTTARALCEFQRMHHETENNDLFGAVERQLDDAGKDRLEQELDGFDEAPSHRAQRVLALELCAELVARYRAASEP
jgi:hemerythrin-like domain-containing protein